MSLLAAISVLSALALGPVETRLPGDVAPERYRLELAVDPASGGYSGSIEIELRLDAERSSLELHAREIAIEDAEVRQGGRSEHARVAAPREGGLRDGIVLALSRPLAPGRATLRLTFHSTFEPRLNGLYHMKDGGAWYAFSQMEPLDARRAFPCFDEPQFKVPWEVSITVPRGQLAFSNSPELTRSDGAAGTTFRFAPTPPISSYLVAIAAGPLEVLEGSRSPVPIRLIAARGKAEAGRDALELAPRLLAILTAEFGRPFPFPKLDLAALPEFAAGAMENPGLITFREEALLTPAGSASTGLRREMTVDLAHELAHQWFGDLVTMSWWDDVWLNEGFATWMGNKVVDRVDPAFRAELGLRAKIGDAMRLDALGRAGPVRQAVAGENDILAAFDDIRYVKGAAVLGMLESWLSPERFRDGVRAYLDKHEWRTAESGDFLAALALGSKENVNGVGASFLEQPGVPLVTAALECLPGMRPRVIFTQRPIGSAGTTGADDPLWLIPIALRFEQAGGARETRFLLTQHEAELELEAATCPAWIHPNAGETGYYRWRLATGTPWPEHSSLSPRERVGLLQNAFGLVESGDLEAARLLDLAADSAGDSDRAVAGAVTQIFSRADRLLVDDASRPAYRTLVSELLRPLALWLGPRPRAGDDDERRILRKELLAVLADVAEDPWVRFEAEAAAPAVLRDPGALEPDGVALALDVGSRDAGPERFAALRAALGEARTPDRRLALLAALSGACDAARLRESLDFGLTGAVRAQDLNAILEPVLRDRESSEVGRAWLLEHWEAVRERLHGWSMGSVVESAIGGACSASEIASLEARFAARVRALEQGGATLERSLERARSCAAVREREAARVREWIRARTSPERQAGVTGR